MVVRTRATGRRTHLRREMYRNTRRTSDSPHDDDEVFDIGHLKFLRRLTCAIPPSPTLYHLRIITVLRPAHPRDQWLNSVP